MTINQLITASGGLLTDIERLDGVTHRSTMALDLDRRRRQPGRAAELWVVADALSVQCEHRTELARFQRVKLVGSASSCKMSRHRWTERLPTPRSRHHPSAPASTSCRCCTTEAGAGERVQRCRVIGTLVASLVCSRPPCPISTVGSTLVAYGPVGTEAQTAAGERRPAVEHLGAGTSTFPWQAASAARRFHTSPVRNNTMNRTTISVSGDGLYRRHEFRRVADRHDERGQLQRKPELSQAVPPTANDIQNGSNPVTTTRLADSYSGTPIGPGRSGGGRARADAAGDGRRRRGRPDD